MNNNWIFYFFTFLVVTISGNPIVGLLDKETVVIGSLALFVLLYIFKPSKFIKQDFWVLSGFVLLTVVHIFVFGFMVISASLGFLIKLIIALLAVRLIPDFFHRYINVMYWLSIISFVFFIPFFLGVDMQGLFSWARVAIPDDTFHYHIIFYNLREEAATDVVRNMSVFWEPGAFAGYLVLALFLLMVEERKGAPISRKIGIWGSRKGRILAIALLTSQSTTGYIAIAVLVLYTIFESGIFKTIAMKIVVLPLAIVVFISAVFVLFTQVSFLGEKISFQYEFATSQQDMEMEQLSKLTRFGNFTYDLNWISSKPIAGWSANSQTRFSRDLDLEELISAQGNGFTGFAVKYGLVGLIIYLGFFAYSTRQTTGSPEMAFFGVVIVCLLLNGEQFLNFSLFLTLMFIPIAHKVGGVGKRHAMNGLQ